MACPNPARSALRLCLPLPIPVYFGQSRESCTWWLIMLAINSVGPRSPAVYPCACRDLASRGPAQYCIRIWTPERTLDSSAAGRYINVTQLLLHLFPWPTSCSLSNILRTFSSHCWSNHIFLISCLLYIKLPWRPPSSYGQYAAPSQLFHGLCQSFTIPQIFFIP